MRPIPPARHGQEETREERRDRRRATKEERKKYIERTLVVKHVIRQRMAETASEDGSTRAGSHSTIDAEQLEGEEPCDPVVPNEEKEAKAYNPKQPIRRLKSNLIISDPDDLEAARDSTREPWICAICLTPYEIGDEICWSQNPECNHVFHHGCIEHWLYNHEECPMCRSIYISLGYDEVDAVPDPNQCCSSQVSSAPLVIMSTAEEQSHGTGEEEIMDLENPTGPALSTVEEVEGTSDGEVVDTF